MDVLNGSAVVSEMFSLSNALTTRSARTSSCNGSQTKYDEG
jgi:hypothetical protein